MFFKPPFQGSGFLLLIPRAARSFGTLALGYIYYTPLACWI
jgi:hypothetical protein